MRKAILLPGMKFMSGGVLYGPGDILPDAKETPALVARGKAEWIDDAESEAITEPPILDGYELKNVRTLAELAKERGIDIPKGTNKAGIIELLEAWDADEGAS
ncbi:MAG: hypothetical protein LBT65_02390 [Synergistaceae bacterium]|jgi:hypothetical protein|nr:hypothetical protein [Synergistaceae bacterium]